MYLYLSHFFKALRWVTVAYHVSFGGCRWRIMNILVNEFDFMTALEPHIQRKWGQFEQFLCILAFLSDCMFQRISKVWYIMPDHPVLTSALAIKGCEEKEYFNIFWSSHDTGIKLCRVNYWFLRKDNCRVLENRIDKIPISSGSRISPPPLPMVRFAPEVNQFYS